MIKKVEQNRKILRQYIRYLSACGGGEASKKAIKYFIILHNFLAIEDRFYDQVSMANKQLNNVLLLQELRSVTSILGKFNLLFDPAHVIRLRIETMPSIEEIKLYLSGEGVDVYKKLII